MFPYSKLAKELEQAYRLDYEITVNGDIFTVQKNLYDALKMLRSRIKAGESSGYFWIDAICINQRDMEEKSRQVLMMDQIYRAATQTIVWVGLEDEFTKDAFSLIKSIGSIPRNRHRPLTLEDFNYKQELILREMGAKPQTIFGTIAGLKWMDILAFFNRPYFSRIWIAQEIILSQSPLFVCGKHEIAWELVSNTLGFLKTSGWYGKLGTQFFREYDKITTKAVKYHKLLEQRNLGAGLPLSNLDTARTGIATSGHLGLFKYLLEAFRESDATNPSDKIYALIGLAWKERPPFSTHPEALIPDYSLEPHALFAKTARLMLLSHKDVRFLCHVEDRSFRKMKGLPSWVPDYTVPLRPTPFYLLSSTKYSASKGLAFSLDDHDLFAKELRVTGFRLSQICAVAKYTVPDDRRDNDRSLAASLEAISAFVAGIDDAQVHTIKM